MAPSSIPTIPPFKRPQKRTVNASIYIFQLFFYIIAKARMAAIAFSMELQQSTLPCVCIATIFYI